LTTKDDNKNNYKTEDIVEAYKATYEQSNQHHLYATHVTKKPQRVKTLLHGQGSRRKLEHPKRVRSLLNEKLKGGCVQKAEVRYPEEDKMPTVPFSLAHAIDCVLYNAIKHV
jgi:hypothetical protein